MASAHVWQLAQDVPFFQLVAPKAAFVFLRK
jgi:hypothetical protein